MASIVDLSKLKTSWTKYDIVRVMEVIYNVETIERFKNKEVGIDEPILRSFLGIKDLSDPIPSYWLEIQNYPKEKKLFALFATIFTHEEIIEKFALSYSKGNMKGIFEIEPGKQYTNIRSSLVESGASEPSYRRSELVPYDFTPIFQNSEVGKLFKKVLLERVSRITKEELTDSFFYETCISNNFHKALSISAEQFKSWLEGASDIENRIIEKVEIENFYSIEDISLDFKNSKEIYFLGENGDGKSLVLMGIYLAFNGNYISEKTDKEKTGKVIDILKNNRSVRLLGQDDNGTKYDLNRAVYLENFFAYGTHRGRYASDNSETYGFMSLFNSDETLVDPVYWLKNQLLLELEKRLDAQNMIGETKSLPIKVSNHNMGTFKNIVIPVRKIQEKGFCPDLKKKIKLTNPISYQLLEMSGTKIVEKSVEIADLRRAMYIELIEGEKAIYAETIFGKLEDKLKNLQTRFV